ncbi:C39 family peptidase, partial [Streptomyces albidoflavus]
MRKRLAATAVALAAAGCLLAPGAAQATATGPGPVAVLEHGSAAGTAVVSGMNQPGTRLHADAVRTSTVRTLEIDYQVQETGYWCGPAATRIALSARLAPPSQT